MTGLVEEMQALALDKDIKVQDLLRRVRVAAIKLNLQGTAAWVDREIKGYAGVDIADMPEYRVWHGQLMQRHPIHGRRIVNGDPQMVGALSMVFLRDPMSSLESLLDVEGQDLAMKLDASTNDLLYKLFDSGWSFYVLVGKNTIISAVAHVRDLVLDWALELESQGILGEGFSFNMTEKQKAQQTAPNITIHGLHGTFVNGGISGSQNRLNIKSSDSSHNSLDMDTTFTSLSQSIRDKVSDPKDREALLTIVKAMHSSRAEGNYQGLYQQLLANAANWMTVLTPFLPALTSYLR
jgi:hypothetical protein